MFNSLVFCGRLSRDTETRYLPSGISIVSGAAVMDHRWKDKTTGEWKKQPCFIDFTIFGKRGEAFARFHSKGSEIFLVGALRQESWTDKTTGVKRSKHVLIVDEWKFCSSSRNPGTFGGGESPNTRQPEPTHTPADPTEYEDTPF